MPKYIVNTPLKAGPHGDERITMPGEEITLSLAEAVPLLERGTIKKPRLASAFSKLFGNKGVVAITVSPQTEDKG